MPSSIALLVVGAIIGFSIYDMCFSDKHLIKNLISKLKEKKPKPKTEIIKAEATAMEKQQ